MANLEQSFQKFFNEIGTSAFGHLKMEEANKQRFELLTSSLRKNGNPDCTLEQAKQFSIADILSHITKLPAPISNQSATIQKLAPDVPFSFIARVDTSGNGSYSAQEIIKQSSSRQYLSYSLVTNKNISHYKTKYPFMLVYNIPPEAIAHIFPADSDTNPYATKDSEISGLPSTWLTFDELTNITNQIGMYNQISCKTQINGQPLLPSAILAFNTAGVLEKNAATALNLPIILVHPNKDAINYVGDSCMVTDNAETAQKYVNMVEVLRKSFVRCFKTKNEKRVFEDFLNSFDAETMGFIGSHPIF